MAQKIVLIKDYTDSTGRKLKKGFSMGVDNELYNRLLKKGYIMGEERDVKENIKIKKENKIAKENKE